MQCKIDSKSNKKEQRFSSRKVDFRTDIRGGVICIEDVLKTTTVLQGIGVGGTHQPPPG